MGFECYPAWRSYRNQVVKNTIGDMLVKDSLISERLQINFQALQFDAHPIGNVSQRKRSEIGLACLGTN